MTQTPNFVFNKNTFAWAVDVAWDFKKNLFDCVAGLAKETKQDSDDFEKVEQIVSESSAKNKIMTEKDSAQMYLAKLVIHCKQSPGSPHTKAFVELWKSIYLLFPNRKRPLESVAAFKCLLSVQDMFESAKAVYYIMHAFAHNTDFAHPEDYKRALTLLSKNDNVTVADLMAVLDVRSDMDEKILRAVVEKCYAKVIELEKKPVAFRDNRKSGDKEYDTKYAYKIKSICSDGLKAAKILININLKYAVDMMTFFEKAQERVKAKPAEDKPEIVMPDINDLSQFPHYAGVLQSVKEAKR